ncbi:insulinase family protein [Streptococcus suis]|nr:insulinase family protein [Streptococcus suis]
MKTKQITLSFTQEKISSFELDNGLTVWLLPKKGIQESYGILTCQFGSVDKLVKGNGKAIPAGMAHFLEHSLFDMPDKRDMVKEFALLSSQVNAFTSQTQTSYFYSTTGETKESLALLLQLVLTPGFTQETVEREQAVIEQEIEMYLDDPEHRLHLGVVASLFPESPLAVDIAGTVDSIQEINVQTLQEVYSYFYQPNKMNLVCIGDMDVNDIEAFLRTYEMPAQSSLANGCQLHHFETKAPVAHSHIELDVATPKLAFGMRSLAPQSIQELPTYRLGLRLFLALLIGWTSERYQDWYREGKIDSSFQFYVDVHPSYHYLVISGDTAEPISLASAIRKTLFSFEKSADFSQEHLELIKREWLGQFLQSVNSVEFLGTYLSEQSPFSEDSIDFPRILAEIDLEMVRKIGRDFLKEASLADFTIFPKS